MVVASVSFESAIRGNKIPRPGAFAASPGSLAATLSTSELDTLVVPIPICAAKILLSIKLVEIRMFLLFILCFLVIVFWCWIKNLILKGADQLAGNRRHFAKLVADLFEIKSMQFKVADGQLIYYEY